MKKNKNKKQILQLANNELLVAGRQQCECQAQLHSLLNNCVVCGRIVCEQEGEGPCHFCGNAVHSKYALKVNQELDSELQFPDLEQKKAIEHRDKLLDYNRKNIHQSSIIDDQVDYYQIADNPWESENIRQEAIRRILDKNQLNEDNQKKMHIQFDPLTSTLSYPHILSATRGKRA